MQTQERPLVVLGGLLTAILLGHAATAQSTLRIDNQTTVIKEFGDSVNFTVTAPPGTDVTLYVDTDPGPSTVFGQQVPLGMSQNLGSIPLGIVPGSGAISNDYPVGWNEHAHGSTLYYCALILDGANVTFTNGADATTVARPQLAGNSLNAYPYFEHVAAFHRSSSIQIAIDPRFSVPNGETVDVYVVASKTKAQWLADPGLVDVRGAPQTITFPAGATVIQQNTFTLTGSIPGPDETPLSGDMRIGVGYDLVIDRLRNGDFDPAFDFIDGFDDTEAGFYVVRDTTLGGTQTAPGAGPLEVAESHYPPLPGRRRALSGRLLPDNDRGPR